MDWSKNFTRVRLYELRSQNPLHVYKPKGELDSISADIYGIEMSCGILGKNKIGFACRAWATWNSRFLIQGFSIIFYEIKIILKHV